MMSEPHESEQAKEPVQESEQNKETLLPVVQSDATTEPQLPAKQSDVSIDSLPVTQSAVSNVATAPGLPEVEWIPGEQLELIKIPPPTIWPVTLALGTTGIAFGVVTNWLLSAAGLFLFLLGAAGWIGDLRKDVLQ